MKKGSIAGTAPWAKSTARWPLASAPIATRSTRRSSGVEAEVIMRVGDDTQAVRDAVRGGNPGFPLGHRVDRHGLRPPEARLLPAGAHPAAADPPRPQPGAGAGRNAVH